MFKIYKHLIEAATAKESSCLKSYKLPRFERG
jgi:hypothetical protein